MLAGRYSLRTIDTYTYRIKLFILFSGKRHPMEADFGYANAYL